MKMTKEEYNRRREVEEVLQKYSVTADVDYKRIAEEIIAKIFLQPDVSINEAHQKENKKVGEVAVAFAKWIIRTSEDRDKKKLWTEHYEEFKKATGC